MDRDTFIKHYRAALEGNLPRKDGINLIRDYIIDKGNDNHKKYTDEFLSLLNFTPLYKYCLKWVLDYYYNEYSVVTITLEDPNAMSARIITIY